MLGRLGKPSPMFSPKKEEKRGKEFLGRLVLVIHSSIYLGIGYFFWDERRFLFTGKVTIEEWITIGGIITIPLIIFTVIYWIVSKKWIYFPWQHDKD
jgi:hypothetical protein